MTELLPCPFCGGEAHTIEPARYGKRWGVLCECGAFMGFKRTEAEAIQAWNTRKPMQNIEAYVRMAIQEAERTCKLIPTRGKKYRPHAPTLTCSNCGAVYELSEANPSETLYGFAYCSNCGAKVIGG